MYKYMRNDLEDKYGFLKLQDKILELTSYIDGLCRENDIDYCLMGGSALGAKRHKGFIPWDDDLDIFMTPDNYEKFREVFKAHKSSSDYHLEESGTFKNMVTRSKLRMNNTTYIEAPLKDYDIHHGIFIDIFILHNCPNTRLLQLWQCLWAKYLVLKGLSIINYSKRGGVVQLVLKILRLFPDRFLLGFALKQLYRYRNKKTDYFCNFLGRAVFKKGIYKREWFEKTKYVDFENTKLKVPYGLEDFLTERFGDYMTPPSADKIKWMQHADLWDTDTDFQEILNRKCTFLDEKKLI